MVPYLCGFAISDDVQYMVMGGNNSMRYNPVLFKMVNNKYVEKLVITNDKIRLYQNRKISFDENNNILVYMSDWSGQKLYRMFSISIDSTGESFNMNWMSETIHNSLPSLFL